MKTKGLFFACAKNALSILTLLAAITASAQFDFASQKNISFSKSKKGFPVNSLTYNYYTVPEPAAGKRILPMISLYRAPATSNDIISATPASSVIENINDLNANDYDISFKPVPFAYPENCKEDAGNEDYSIERLFFYAAALKSYARQNDFDTTYGFLTDMSMVSDKKRFFVINLTTMEVEQSGLVAQGRGQGPSRFDKQYSNIAGSKCTSLGRYKIMNKYTGEYGESYRLSGLDSSNSNAFSRCIVLHPMGCILDEEEVMPTCISEGCPAVSVKFIRYLSKIIDAKEKPVLLWIFDSNLEEVVIKQKAGIKLPEPEYVTLNGQHACSMHHHDDILIQ